MGMYDTIICLAALPGTTPEWIKPGHSFQTKDLDCTLTIYHIQEDGRLVGHDGQPVPFTGTIEFYTSNIAAWGPGIYTVAGEDAESVEYRASFKDGAMLEISQTSYRIEPALPVSQSVIASMTAPTETEMVQWKARESEDLTGREVFVCHGNEDPLTGGFFGKVVAMGTRKLVIMGGPIEFMIEYRSNRDSLFFDSRQDAVEHDSERRKPFQECREKYDRYAAEWHEKRGKSPNLEHQQP